MADSDKKQDAEAANGNGGDEKKEEAVSYEKELAGYLQERIKPGLNSGAIPMLARSIAKELAHRQPPNGATPEAPAADESSSGGDEAAPDFEADMHELQAELGDDWILRFSVQGDKAWLTAEKEDGTQRIEAPNASVISEAVELINEGGGRG